MFTVIKESMPLSKSDPGFVSIALHGMNSRSYFKNSFLTNLLSFYGTTCCGSLLLLVTATDRCPNSSQYCPPWYFLIKGFHCPLYEVETKSPTWCVSFKSRLILTLFNTPALVHSNAVFLQAGVSKKLCAYRNSAALAWNIWEFPYWNSLQSLWDAVLPILRQLFVFWWWN